MVARVPQLIIQSPTSNPRDMDENPSKASLNENGDWEVAPNLNGSGDVVIFDSFCRPEQVRKKRSTLMLHRHARPLHTIPRNLTGALPTHFQVDIRNADRDPARFGPRTHFCHFACEAPAVL